MARMSNGGPVFRVYCLDPDDGYRWRLISPNGRGIAQAVFAAPTPERARDVIAHLVARLDRMEMALAITASYRWRWTLSLDGRTVVEEIGDSDRRVRCEQSCRKFVDLAPAAEIAPTVYLYGRSGSRPVREVL